MNTVRAIAIATLLGSLGILPACRADRTPAEQEEKSLIGRAVSEAMTEAREEIHKGNITLSGDGNLAKAEITPQGDLLIDGRAVAINPEQRALLLEYRGHVTGVAESGMEIGAHGADLAGKAVGEVVKGLLDGKSEREIGRSIEAEAAQIKASAAKLCARLPAMMASQQKLAAALPEFKPYARMTQEDIDECYSETAEAPTPPAAPSAPDAPDAPNTNG